MPHSKATCINNPEKLNKAFEISLCKDSCHEDTETWLSPCRRVILPCSSCSFLAKPCSSAGLHPFPPAELGLCLVAADFCITYSTEMVSSPPSHSARVQKSVFVGFFPLNVTLNTEGKEAQGYFYVFHLLTLDGLSCRAQPTHSFSWAFNSCTKLNWAQNSNNFKNFPRDCGCSACLWEVQHCLCLGHRRVPRQAVMGIFLVSFSSLSFERKYCCL